MNDLIKQGIQKGLISISDDGKTIKYINYHRPKNYINPEEQIQALTFLKLVIDYGYDYNRIKHYVAVKMGRDTKEADLVIYNDDECEEPYILVECKKEDVSEQEFLQAIEQAYSYAYALPNNVKYVWVTSGLRDEYFVVDKQKSTKIDIPDIPQFGVKKLANYKYVYDAESLASEAGKQKFSDIEVITEEELTKQFKKAHDALWAGGQLNPSEAFDELDKLIFCKIWDERLDRMPGQPYHFQIITVDKEEIRGWQKLSPDQLKEAIRKEENKRLAERIKSLYEEGRKKDPEVFRDDIRLSDERIRTVVGYLQSINLGETDLDSKGRAFETFMSTFFRGNFGQYFTPRPIVKFIVDVLPITKDSYVLDTSCGSGGFLLYALNKIRNHATKMYPKYKTDPNHKLKHYKYWHDFAENNLYGIEINEQISRAAKMNMIIHDDGHTNVITADGLLNEKEIQKITSNKGFKYNHFDFIITNPPFGSTIRQTEKAYLKEFKLGKKEADWLAVIAPPETTRENQSTEILFIEQCHRYLREAGYLAMVIPDGILTNSSLQYVRDNIESMFRIVSVVSFPQTAFTANGAGVKSSVIILQKHKEETEEQIIKQRQDIQEEIRKANDYAATIEQWDKELKIQIRELEKQAKAENPKFDKKAITELIKDRKAELQAKLTERKNNLREQMVENYQSDYKKQIEKRNDYPIFMAIADEIGYDATGKKTDVNELDTIGEELTKFINAVENKEI